MFLTTSEIGLSLYISSTISLTDTELTSFCLENMLEEKRLMLCPSTITTTEAPLGKALHPAPTELLDVYRAAPRCKREASPGRCSVHTPISIPAVLSNNG